MCLAVPGQVIGIQGEDLNRTGQVSFSGVVRTVSLAYVPEANLGDFVIVHVGVAISKLDSDAAQATLHYLSELDKPIQQ